MMSSGECTVFPKLLGLLKRWLHIQLDLWYCTCEAQLTSLNAPPLIPNHLCCVTKLLGKAVLKSLDQSSRSHMGRVSSDDVLPWCSIDHNPEPPKAAQTWWKRLPNLNYLVAHLPQNKPWLQTFVLLNEKTICCVVCFSLVRSRVEKNKQKQPSNNLS